MFPTVLATSYIPSRMFSMAVDEGNEQEAAGGSVDIYSSLDDFTNGALRIWHMHQDATISRNAVLQALERNRSTPYTGLTMEQWNIIHGNTGVISQVDIADAFDHGPLP